ncbi:hypothetical protein AHF37_04663 [Paragonimus kellicotti]|nr:hypothetical protein AHF37_04663 [Paragonimus kellicotti]
MAGVNFWSVLLTLIPLVQQDSLLSSLRFGFEHHEFMLDVCLSATCSAIGQLFIFLTIANFGPATFALIMTLRMGLSILLSCLLFHHTLSPAANSRIWQPFGLFTCGLVSVCLHWRLLWGFFLVNNEIFEEELREVYSLAGVHL